MAALESSPFARRRYSIDTAWSYHARATGAGAALRDPNVTSKSSRRSSGPNSLKPIANESATLARPPRLCTISRNDPRSNGALRKSGAPLPWAASQTACTAARNDVLPVLFSPTRRVSGAR